MKVSHFGKKKIFRAEVDRKMREPSQPIFIPKDSQ